MDDRKLTPTPVLPNGQLLAQIDTDSEGSDGEDDPEVGPFDPRDRTVVDASTAAIYLDILAQRLSEPSDPSVRPKDPPISMKQDPLPYSMCPVLPGDALCALCGPPFKVDPELLENMTICSFACGKRYVVEHLGISNGFRIKHAKSPLHSTGLEFDIEPPKYDKLCLHCHCAGNYKPQKSAPVPEARRNTSSKKTGCPFRVNISRTKTTGRIWISKVVLVHNHANPDAPAKAGRFYQKLSKRDIETIQSLTTLGATRTQILKVKAHLIYLTLDLA